MSDISNNVIFALKTSLLSERHLMTVVTNMHTSYSRHMSCHDYEGVMSVLSTPPNYFLIEIGTKSLPLFLDYGMIFIY